MKKMQKAWIITIISVIISIVIYLIIVFLFSIKDFFLGLIISTIIPVVIAYPISSVIMEMYTKLEGQKIIIENNYRDVDQSIIYASLIQQILLPSDQLIAKKFNSHFI